MNASLSTAFDNDVKSDEVPNDGDDDVGPPELIVLDDDDDDDAAAAAVFLRPTPVTASFVLWSLLRPSPLDCDEAMLLLALVRLVMECCRDLIVV